MQEEKSGFVEVENPNVNISVANLHCLVSSQSEKGKEFNEHLHKIMDKLFANNIAQKSVVEHIEFDFYLQDTQDESIARIRSKEDIEAWNLDGDRFAVMFNKEKLQKVTSEDELAFIMGHEISHVLWKKGVEAVRDQHSNEELACDFNSINLMQKAGYSLNVVKGIDTKLHPLQKQEMVMRAKERENKIASMCYSYETKPFDAASYVDAKFEKWSNKYEVPAKEDTEDATLDKMVKNLDMVYRKGGEDSFAEMFGSYINSIGSEKASKLFMNMTARVAEEFPPIDEVKKGPVYKEQFRHPISVLGELSNKVSNLEGKKLYPPQAQAKINKYAKDNPNYFGMMSFVWDKWTKPSVQAGNKIRD